MLLLYSKVNPTKQWTVHYALFSFCWPNTTESHTTRKKETEDCSCARPNGCYVVSFVPVTKFQLYWLIRTFLHNSKEDVIRSFLSFMYSAVERMQLKYVALPGCKIKITRLFKMDNERLFNRFYVATMHINWS